MRAAGPGLPHVLALAVCVVLGVALFGSARERAVVVDLPASAPAAAALPGDAIAASLTADDVARGTAALARKGALSPSQRAAVASQLRVGAEARTAREAARAAARASRAEAVAAGLEVARILGEVPE